MASGVLYADNDPIDKVDPLGLRPVNDFDLRFDPFDLLPSFDWSWPFGGEGTALQPATASSSFMARPGYGQLRINLFIMAAEVDALGGFHFVGDGRDFSLTAGPEQSRASFNLDFETGRFDAFVNYSCQTNGTCASAYRVGINTPSSDPVCANPTSPPTGVECHTALEASAPPPNRVRLDDLGNGHVRVNYQLRNAAAPSWYPTPSIDGTLTITPKSGSTSLGVCVDGDHFPSIEAYQDVGGATQVRAQWMEYSSWWLLSSHPNLVACGS